MNYSKTEFIYFGRPRQLEKCITNIINDNEEVIQRTGINRYLGAYLDLQLNFGEHIKMKFKAVMINVLKIRATRKFLTKYTCAKNTISLVISHLDYANSLLIGLPEVSLDQLQRVQNIAAKIVLNKSKYGSSTMCLEQLHCLPIQQQILFKVNNLSLPMHPWTSS